MVENKRMLAKWIDQEIQKRVTESTDQIAIFDEKYSLTFQELTNAVENAVSQLERVGVGEHDIVALRLIDPVNLAICFLALLKMGVCQTTLTPYDPLPQQVEVLERTNANIVLQDFSLKNSLIKNTLKLGPSGSLFRHPDYNVMKKKRAYAGYMLLTLGSGTTGKPKLLAFDALALMDRFKKATSLRALGLFEKGEVFYFYTTLYFTYTKFLLVDALISGVRLLLPRQRPEFILKYCISHGVNHLDLTASQIRIVVTEAEERYGAGETGPLLNELKTLCVTSAPTTVSLRQKIRKLLTPNLYIRYGTNEYGIVTMATPSDIDRVPDTVGRVIPSVEIEIHDEKGERIRDGTAGNIFVKRSSYRAATYPNNPEALQNAFRNGGYYPGDLGRLNEGGQLVYLGRADDMMIVTGANIYPAEIESVMERHPAVAEAAVFPLWREGEEQIPFAAVRLGTPISEERLMAWCQKYLGWKRPARIFFVEELPKNSMGKVLKKLLAQQVAKLFV